MVFGAKVMYLGACGDGGAWEIYWQTCYLIAAASPERREGTVLTHATLQQSTMQQREKDKRQIQRQVLLRNNDTHKDRDKKRRGLC